MPNIAIVQEVSSNTANSLVSSFTPTISGTAAANAIILTAFVGGTGNTLTLASDTQGLTWVQRNSVLNSGQHYLYKQWTTSNLPGGSDTITLNFGFANTQYGAFITEFVNVALAPYDGANGAYQSAASSGSNTVTTGTATNANQPAMVYAFAHQATGGATMSVGTGFTSQTGTTTASGVGGNLLSEYQRILTTSAIAATYTLGGGGPDAVTSLMVILDEFVSSAPPSYYLPSLVEF